MRDWSRVLLLAASLAPAAAPAQERETPPPAASPAAAPAARAERDPENRGQTPRGAVRGFLLAGRAGDFEAAARYLDLRGARLAPGGDALALARQLFEVVERRLPVETGDVSDEPQGDLDDDLPPRRESLGAIGVEEGMVEVLLDHVAVGQGRRLWRFSPETVARVPELWERHGTGLVGRLLPQPVFHRRALGLALWQWLTAALLAALALSAAGLLASLVLRVARAVSRRTRTDADDAVLAAARRPLALLLALALFAAGSRLLLLPLRVQEVLAGLGKGLAILGASWFVLRLVRIGGRVVEGRLVARGHRAATTIVPLAGRTIQIALLLLALLVFLQNVGFNVTSLVAGLGIGGLAVALAGQKTLENFFGGLSLVLDHPVRIGEFCRYGDKLGTVEDIGLRSTRIRTLERTVVTVPNAEFASLHIENFGPRDRILLLATVRLRYETTLAQTREVMAAILRLLRAEPGMSPDARVRLVALGESSIDLEIFAYVLTADHDEFLVVRERVLLGILEVVERAGTSLAFRTQTVYVRRDEPVGEEREAAEGARPRADGDADAPAGGRPSGGGPPATE